MSDTPRNDDTPEFRDPTAPSDSPSSSDSTSSGDSGSFDRTAPIDTDQTQAVPPVPPAPAGPPPAPPLAPPSAPAAQPSYGPPPGAAPQDPYGAPPTSGGTPPPPPPPHNPHGSSPGPAPQNPYGGQSQYPTQGQVQQGYGATPGYGAPAYGAPGYGQPSYATARTNNGSAIALTAVSGALLLLTCGGAFLASIPGLVMGIMGITKHSTDPAGAARITKIGWIVFAALLVLSILAFIGILVAGFSTSSGSSFDSGY